MRETLLYGHEEIKKAINEICVNSKAYSIGRVRPSNYIIHLDRANGRTTLARYITEKFYKHSIIKFSSKDLFLEIDFDGTLKQLQESFGYISLAACYANSYEGVLFFGIDSLGDYIHETQVELFLDNIAKVSETATLIFYVPENPSRSISQLIDKIRDVLKDTVLIEKSVYTATELTLIVESMLEKRGIEIDQKAQFHEQLVNLIAHMELKTIDDVKELSKRIILLTDYSSLISRVGSSQLRKMRHDVLS